MQKTNHSTEWLFFISAKESIKMTSNDILLRITSVNKTINVFA